MIILEGTDHTGKTTAAQALCEILAERMKVTPGALYGHMSRPPDDFDHVGEYMRRVRAGVQDRYHLGSIVYGRVLGGGTFCTARKMKVVQSYLRWRGCLVVAFTCSRDVLRGRIASSVDKEEMYRVDQILDANEAYVGLTKSTNEGEPYVDEVIDVSSAWPTRARLEELADSWWRRFMT